MTDSRPESFWVRAEDGLSQSYAAFHSEVARLARGLRDQGLARGQRLAFVADNRPQTMVIFFSCLRLGVTAVPLHPALPAAEVESQLAVARPDWFLGFSAPSRLQYQLAESGLEWEDVDPDGAWTIHFTSGSTGEPKGVVHTARSLFGAAQAFNQAMGMDDRTCLLHVMPMGYMAGLLNTILCPYAAGGRIVLTSGFSPLAFWEIVRQYGVDTLWLSPTMLASLLRLHREEATGSLRRVCVGTAPLDADQESQFEALVGCPVYLSYGLSEVLFVTGNRPLHDGDGVGPAFAGVELRLDEKGEILVRSPYAAAGYLTASQSAVQPLPEWFATGDLGRLEGDRLFVDGRCKDIILRGGLNVSAARVEQVLALHPEVERVAVMGLPHALLGEEVVACLILKGQHADWQETVAQMQGLAKQYLSPEWCPSQYYRSQEFPLSPSGKIRKAALKSQLLRGEHGRPTRVARAKMVSQSK